jgi:hypothetical protein
MSQRVTIQYSVEVEEVEAETVRLTQKAFDHLNEAMAKANEVSPERLATLANVEKIEEVRQCLARADYVFRDVTQLLNGYISYKSESTPSQAPLPPPVDEVVVYEEE